MKKKGFTLIELLAVIVILSIIALISVPIILNMIESAKKSGAKSSAYGYIEAIEYNNGLSEIENSGYIKVEDGIKEVNSIIGLKMKGKAPEFGEVNIEKGKVKSATLCINGYEVKYKNKDATITGKCDVSNIIKLEKISVTEDNITLDIDGTYQIEPIFEPEDATYKNVTYEVKDSSIITVSSTGLITGIKEGNTTITIKGSNGKNTIIKVVVKDLLKNAKFNFDFSKTQTLEKFNKIGTGTVTQNVGYVTLSGAVALETLTDYSLKNSFTVVTKVRNLSHSSQNSYSLLFGNGKGGGGVGSLSVGLFMLGNSMIMNMGINDKEILIGNNLFSFNDEKWHYIVIRYNTEDNNELSLWIDGVKKESKSLSISSKNGKFYIGGWSNVGANDSGAYFGGLNGDYSNVVIFENALLDTEIQDLNL